MRHALTAGWTALADTSPNKVYNLQNISNYEVHIVIAESEPEASAAGNVLVQHRNLLAVGTARHGSGESIWVRSSAGDNTGTVFGSLLFSEDTSVGPGGSGLGGGSGSGAFGAIISQGGGSLTRREAVPIRTNPTQPERPSAASDTWARSFGGNSSVGPRLTLTSPEGAAIVIQFDNDASVEGYQILVRQGSFRAFNPSTRVLTLATDQSVSQAITYINGAQGFPGTASLAPGALGGRHPEVQSHTVGGLVFTYYSQVLIVNNLLQGDASNLSVVVDEPTTSQPAFTVDWEEDDRVLTIYIGGVSITLAGLVSLGSNIVAASGEFTQVNFGVTGGVDDNGDDAPAAVVGSSVDSGQRIDFTGGRDAGEAEADAGRGLFVYDEDTDPSWELRLVERQREEAANRAGFTIEGANDSSLRVLLGDADDQRNVLTLDGTEYLPETVNQGRVVDSQATDNWTPRDATLDYNDVVEFRAVTAGADGNNLTVRMLEGTPAVEAVTALGAVASLVDGGTRLVEVDWPESLGADANGRQVQVGAPRNIAGVQATAAIYGPTFNDRIGTATWYLPGSAINGIRVGTIGTGLSTQADNTAVGSAAGTLDNILFINVRIAGTVSYQDVIDAFNAIRVSGTQILTATLDNGIDGTTTFDPTQNLGADFAGGVDGTADEVSGTAYWSRAVGLLYLASDGTVTAAQAVTAINAARTGATASVDTEATNNNIRFTAVQSGALGNGIQIVISRGSGYTVSVSGRVITVTYPNVASSSGTLIDTINGNTDAAALITASAIDSTVNFNSNRYVGTFTTAGGADGFDGMAALVAQGVSGTVVPNQTVTASGGVTAAPAQPRTPLTVRERTVSGNQQLLITGILPNVDTVGIVRAAYTDTTKAFEIIALGANQDYVITTSSGANTVLLNTNLTGGRDMGTRPQLAFTILFAGGQVRVNLLNLIGSNYDSSLQTTLAQVKTALEALNNVSGQIEFVETGDQSNPIATPYPTELTGGANYVPPSSIEFLKRGEDEVDGKNIEVRYHADVDTLENLLDAALDSGRNPDGVEVIVIAGTEIDASPQATGVEKPMVPGAGGGDGALRTPAQIGELAFENPPSDLTNPQQAAVRNAIGAHDGSATGLSQAEVDARVNALVRDPALNSDNAAWPDNKIPASIARDTEVTSSISTAVSGLLGGVAAAGDTLQKLYNLIVARLTQTQVDARVEAGVIDEAQTGNTDPFAESKIPTSIARTSAIPEVIDDLGMAIAGTTLTLTAGQTGSAADIVATVDLESLEEYQGEWSSIPEGTAIRAGEFLTHSGRFYYVKVSGNRGNSGPDADSTNYGVLDNYGGTYDGTAYYPAATMVDYASGIWWTSTAVVPGDPNPDATANTKWHRLTDNIDAFTGATRSGAAITFTRESGTNPVTIAEAANGFGLARIGSFYSFTAGSANYQDTGIPLPTNPDDSDVFFFLARFAGLTGQGTLSGTEVKALPTVTTSGSIRQVILKLLLTEAKGE